jgi:hypothetical protein
LSSIGTITLLKATVSLLSVGVSKKRVIEEFDPEQGTSYQTTTKVVPSTIKFRRLLCQSRGFIGRQGLSINLLPS